MRRCPVTRRRTAMPVRRRRAAAVVEEGVGAAAVDISSDSDAGPELGSEEESSSDEDYVDVTRRRALMPVTRRRAAAVVEEGVGAAAVDISSDSDAGPESGSSSSSSSSEEEEEEESNSDEDYVDVSDSGDDCIDISDNGDDCIDSGSDADDDDGSCAGNVEEDAKAEQSWADGRESRRKIEDLLRRGRNLDGIKLIECRAYLIQNGLSQTGDLATCVERIMLHWRFKDGDPEKIYPRSSFCINCKGDVCRGDAVLFKQEVYEKSGKKRSKCIGKRIVAGKVIKESYGEKKQQHTFTVQVFWSKGVGKLQPLCLLLIKGRNLYRTMTFRQPWLNEADRLEILEEKHSRGDAARRFRALTKANPGGHVLKDKKSMAKGKHRTQHLQSDGGSKVTKGKNRVMPTNSDMPTKTSRKQEHPVSSGNSRRAKRNCAALEKKSMEEGKHQSQHRHPDGGSKITKGKKRVMQSSNSDTPTKKSRKQEHLVSSENGQRAKRNCASLEKKSMEDGKHQYQHRQPDGGSKITKGKKRVKQSSNSDKPTKIPRKQEHLVSSENSLRAKRNCDALEKNICTSSNSSLCNDNSETNRVTLQRNCHVAPVNICTSSNSSLCNDNSETNRVTLQRNCHVAPVNICTSSNSSLCNDNSETNRVTLQRNCHVAPVNHAHFEGRQISSASQVQPNCGNSAGIQQPHLLREVGNAWQPRIDGRSIACPNPTMAFQHPNAALANWRAPAYFREPNFSFPTPVNYAHFERRHINSASQVQPNHGNLAGIQQPSFEMPRQTPLSRAGNAWQPPLDQHGVFFPPFYMSQTTYRPRPQGASVMPEFRYSGGSNGFHR